MAIRKKTNAAPATPAPAAAPAPAPAAAPVSRSETKGSGTAAPKAVKAAASVAAATPTHQDIARRAYEIYAGRGYTPGDPAADWSEAERQLKAAM